MTDQSQTSIGLSVYGFGGLHKVLTLPATVLLAETNSVMFLKTAIKVLFATLLKKKKGFAIKVSNQGF